MTTGGYTQQVTFFIPEPRHHVVNVSQSQLFSPHAAFILKGLHEVVMITGEFTREQLCVRGEFMSLSDVISPELVNVSEHLRRCFQLFWLVRAFQDRHLDHIPLMLLCLLADGVRQITPR